MTIKRSKGAAGRRLRVETLEERAVPAVETDVLPIEPVDDGNTPVIVDILPADDVIPTDTMVDGELDPDVIFQTTSDGEPETDTADPVIDLAATATIDKSKPSLGDVVTVTVTVTNNGDDPATGVKVSSVLPAGLQFVSATSGLGAGAYDAATGDWAVGTVGPDGSVVLKIKAKVMDAAEQAVSASITAADQTDPEAENNTASLTVMPVLAVVKLSKSASTPNPAVGTSVIITIAVRNAGPGTARNVAVADTLGDGLRFIRALPPSRGSFAQATKTWNIATLPAGTTATLQIVAQVVAAKPADSPASMTATGIDEMQSTLSATVLVTGSNARPPANWSYVHGPGFRPGPVPSVIPFLPPNGPIIAPNRAVFGIIQIMFARGLILPAPGI